MNAAFQGVLDRFWAMVIVHQCGGFALYAGLAAGKWVYLVAMGLSRTLAFRGWPRW